MVVGSLTSTSHKSTNRLSSATPTTRGPKSVFSVASFILLLPGSVSANLWNDFSPPNSLDRKSAHSSRLGQDFHLYANPFALFPFLKSAKHLFRMNRCFVRRTFS